MNDNKIFITGASGQLGQALQKQYPNAKKADINELDITRRESVLNYNWSGITHILNAAAFTNVDGAETPEGRVAAWKVNATAVGYLCEAARKYNLTLVHISSDYVFDGSKSPHSEDEPLSPLSVYGASKAAGDLLVSQLEKHYILRTSWVIGEGKNFVKTMIELAQKGVSPTVVNDQIGCLTFTSELVRGIDYLLTQQSPVGTYNLTNSGDPASWADVTRLIFKIGGFNLKVSNTTTAEYFAGKPGIAPRPLNSEMSLNKLISTGFIFTDWQDDLEKYVKKELVL